jgi:Skp family chaperone for outer membrane proteins
MPKLVRTGAASAGFMPDLPKPETVTTPTTEDALARFIDARLAQVRVPTVQVAPAAQPKAGVALNPAKAEAQAKFDQRVARHVRELDEAEAELREVEAKYGDEMNSLSRLTQEELAEGMPATSAAHGLIIQFLRTVDEMQNARSGLSRTIREFRADLARLRRDAPTAEAYWRADNGKQLGQSGVREWEASLAEVIGNSEVGGPIGRVLSAVGNLIANLKRAKRLLASINELKAKHAGTGAPALTYSDQDTVGRVLDGVAARAYAESEASGDRPANYATPGWSGMGVNR